MFWLLILSIIIACSLHRKSINRYFRAYNVYWDTLKNTYRSIYSDSTLKFEPASLLPMKDSLILAGIMAVPAIGIYFFIRKYPMLGIIPIAIFTAAIIVWAVSRNRAEKVEAACAFSLIPAALTVISKGTLADNISSVSIGSILLGLVVPIGVTYLAGLVRWAYYKGLFMENPAEGTIGDAAFRNTKKICQLYHDAMISQNGVNQEALEEATVLFYQYNAKYQREVRKCKKMSVVEFGIHKFNTGDDLTYFSQNINSNSGSGSNSSANSSNNESNAANAENGSNTNSSNNGSNDANAENDSSANSIGNNVNTNTSSTNQRRFSNNSDEYEDLYSDDRYDPAKRKEKQRMFYYVVFGLLAIVAISCLSVILMKL